jgi:hypothetical protein
MNSPARPTLTPTLLAGGWFTRFVNRTSPYALQQPDGSYRWVYEDVTRDLLARHLAGEVTLALASANAQAQTRWVCVDVDVPCALPQLAALGDALEEQGLPNLVEESRRGGHLWLFFSELVPVHMARYLAHQALVHASQEGLEVPAYELYPLRASQETIAQAVRLPLGIHRKTDQRYPLWDYPAHDGRPATWSLDVAASLVLQVASIPATLLRESWEARVPVAVRLTPLPVTPPPEEPLPVSQGRGTRSPVIRWVDAQVNPLELLEELTPQTQMKRQGQGYLGWCPFHDDRAPDGRGRPGTPSFYVVHDQRYGWSWRCFSTNCRFRQGHMKHTFQLFQELLQRSVSSAILEAISRWPACIERHGLESPQGKETTQASAGNRG